jgi:hypothetical protein
MGATKRRCELLRPVVLRGRLPGGMQVTMRRSFGIQFRFETDTPEERELAIIAAAVAADPAIPRLRAMFTILDRFGKASGVSPDEASRRLYEIADRKRALIVEMLGEYEAKGKD